MADLQASIADDRAAVAAYLAAVRALPEAAWTQPVAHGKWSPGQLTEHLALTYEFCSLTVHGTPPGKALPHPLRPLVRWFILNPVLKAGRFTRKLKAPDLFVPAATPAPRAEGTARLFAAATRFEAAAATADSVGQRNVNHPFFGTVSLPRYLDMQAIHTRHHHLHLPSAAAAR